jgi:septal ring factor EnvC (AmiA/AmiB activator)
MRYDIKERNKEISILKKETKTLSRILGEIQQEHNVLTTLVDAQQASERKEQKRHNDDRQKRRAATFIQSC